MIQAIVFSSNTGYTARYAQILGEKTGLKVLPLREAEKALTPGAEILYLGWLMAGSVNGLKAARKRFSPRAILGVGMGGTGTQIAEIRKANTIDEATPVFTLQGGFDLKKLHGIYHFMMWVMCKTAGKRLAAKPNRTEDEERMLQMMLHGGDYVSEENLKAVLEWFESQKA